MSSAEELAKRIESQALISARPGQLADLEQVALEVRALGHELEEVERSNSRMIDEIETLRRHKRSFQDVVIFTTEHVAAICAELDLSYEAETEVVIAAIRRLRDSE